MREGLVCARSITRGSDVEKIRIEQHTTSGSLWFAGWLFTIGYLHLPFWKGAVAIVLWPYYIGAAIQSWPH
jgi:hypothetical protein